jgi:hypothetical protein
MQLKSKTSQQSTVEQGLFCKNRIFGFSVIFCRLSVFFGFLNTDVGLGFGFPKNRLFGFGFGYRPSSTTLLLRRKFRARLEKN